MKPMSLPSWAAASAFTVALCLGVPSPAFAQIRIVLNERVSYSALTSSGSNQDRPSIAVRNDGLVRIAIADFQGTCCPLQVPLKVATRGATGGWTHLTVNAYGDHPVPHFLRNGNLGVTYNDFQARMTIRFAEVTASSATIQSAYSLGLNPSGFTRLTPWAAELTGGIQAIIQRGIRLRRITSSWSNAPLSGTLHDLVVKLTGEVLILSNQGLWTFAGPGLTLTGKLVPVSVGSGGNLVLDSAGVAHIAFISGGKVTYGKRSGTGFTLETVATNARELLNDQALLLDANNTPYVIYRNAASNIVVATKTPSGWSEQANLGPGVHGTMVAGKGGRFHVSFTNTSDRLVHYAILQPVPALTASPSTISIATGGPHTFTLNAGTANASRLYWIFGSVTGTSPGVTLISAVGAVTIPLVPDFYTTITIAQPNTALLVKTKSALDASGKGQASLMVPKINDQNAIGVKLYHAYLVYDAQNNFHMASNPVTLTLVK
ncbi:MAG: hypothetical protein ACYS5W_15105 [Planctomycetota bacterium]